MSIRHNPEDDLSLQDALLFFIISENSSSAFQHGEGAQPAGRPVGVTGSLVRSQGAVASNGGALHLVSRPQETGKQNLLLHAVLPNPQPSPMA